MLHAFNAATRLAGLALIASTLAAPAAAQAPSWVDQKLLEAAKKEGSPVVYGSMNEQEALPYYKIFTDATGIKVTYVRTSDTGVIGRIAVELRARQNSWDVVMTTPVNRLPDAALAQFDPPEAKALMPQARDPNRRWYGVYANYNSPAYNTKFVKREQLPKTYEDFPKMKEWRGRIAIDNGDTEWLMAMFSHYGEEKGRKLVRDIVTTLAPVVTEGHLALARAVGSGEYWVALNNYTNLTVNVKLSGAPIDFWAMDPVALIFGSVGIAANAPNPNAARLLANYVLSREAQVQLTKRGRIPTRTDTRSNPPDVSETLLKQKVVTAVLSATEQKRWQSEFQKLFKPK
ncbi:MAG: extracellular solute-binding protein [Rhizobiales bacterium]|nr:extracellular solute-binding protein [Hyphomicrobiales bacterium]